MIIFIGKFVRLRAMLVGESAFYFAIHFLVKQLHYKAMPITAWLLIIQATHNT